MTNENNPGAVSAGAVNAAVWSHHQNTSGVADRDLLHADPIRLERNSLPVATIVDHGLWYGRRYFVVSCPCHEELQTFEVPYGAPGNFDNPGPFKVECRKTGQSFRAEKRGALR